MAIQVSIPPVEEPLTLDEAKAQCRVDVADDDTLITALIVAAREYCEARDWRAYVTQTLDLYLDAWPVGSQIELPRPPVQSVTSITYTDEDGTAATISASDYVLDTVTEPGRIVLKSNISWPSVTLQIVNGIVVRYVAGYGLAVAVPQRIKQAMLLLVGHWYENREQTTVGAVSRSIEFAVESLLGVERAFRF